MFNNSKEEEARNHYYLYLGLTEDEKFLKEFDSVEKFVGSYSTLNNDPTSILLKYNVFFDTNSNIQGRKINTRNTKYLPDDNDVYKKLKIYISNIEKEYLQDRIQTLDKANPLGAMSLTSHYKVYTILQNYINKEPEVEQSFYENIINSQLYEVEKDIFHAFKALGL